MKPNEIIAFPADKLIAAGISNDALVTLQVSGDFYSHGPIRGDDLNEVVPTETAFREIAGVSEAWDVKSVTVNVENPPSGSTERLRFEFSGHDVEATITDLSQRYPVAAYKVAFIDGNVTSRQLRVLDLASVTYREGRLWFNGGPLKWRDGWFDSKFVHYWVASRGGRCKPGEFTWGSAPMVELCGTLMDMQSHLLTAHVPIKGSEALDVLRQKPERWAAVAGAFIDRFSRREARNLLGEETLRQVLTCGFRNPRTIISADSDVLSAPMLRPEWEH